MTRELANIVMGTTACLKHWLAWILAEFLRRSAVRPMYLLAIEPAVNCGVTGGRGACLERRGFAEGVEYMGVSRPVVGSAGVARPLLAEDRTDTGLWGARDSLGSVTKTPHLGGQEKYCMLTWGQVW